MSLQMENEDSTNYFECKAPRFIKVILQESLQENGKLDIPRKFVSLYGAHLLSSDGGVVHLKVPCGTVWKLGLGRDENDMWFQAGWIDFAKFYGLKFGHFVIFTYQGSSRFDVVIYDWTACEIRYPIRPCSDKEEGNTNHGMFSSQAEDADVEILEDVNLFKNTGSSSKPKSGEAGVCKAGSSKKGGRKAVSAATSGGNFQETNRGACTPKLAERDNANPSFSVVMRPSYVQNIYSLNVPGKFMKLHLGPKNCLVKLYTNAGRCWTVQCDFNYSRDRVEAKIRRGWRKFAQDHELAIGDTCVFELITSPQMYFQVSILRAQKGGSASCSKHKMNSRTSYGYEAKRIKQQNEESSAKQIHLKPSCAAVSEADLKCENVINFVPKYPSFKLILTAYYLKHSSVPVNIKFVRMYFTKKEQSLKFKVGDKLWNVKACVWKNMGALCTGWLNFTRDNSLQAGDICIFELIKMEDMVLNVSIFRNRQA